MWKRQLHEEHMDFVNFYENRLQIYQENLEKALHTFEKLFSKFSVAKDLLGNWKGEDDVQIMCFCKPKKSETSMLTKFNSFIKPRLDKVLSTLKGDSTLTKRREKLTSKESETTKSNSKDDNEQVDTTGKFEFPLIASNQRVFEENRVWARVNYYRCLEDPIGHEVDSSEILLIMKRIDTGVKLFANLLWWKVWNNLIKLLQNPLDFKSDFEDFSQIFPPGIEISETEFRQFFRPLSKANLKKGFELLLEYNTIIRGMAKTFSRLNVLTEKLYNFYDHKSRQKIYNQKKLDYENKTLPRLKSQKETEAHEESIRLKQQEQANERAWYDKLERERRETMHQRNLFRSYRSTQLL